jgi:hypothetical protein
MNENMYMVAYQRHYRNFYMLDLIRDIQRMSQQSVDKYTRFQYITEVYTTDANLF